MTLNFTNGTNWVGRLIVKNVSGISEERGYRLFWESPDGRYLCPALGYATSHPFQREADARFYAAQRGWGKVWHAY